RNPIQNSCLFQLLLNQTIVKRIQFSGCTYQTKNPVHFQSKPTKKSEIQTLTLLLSFGSSDRTLSATASTGQNSHLE
ncbi:hypothetical protein Pfo_022683, partial [Paulownia fortunei]